MSPRFLGPPVPHGHPDPALDTLFLPLDSGALAWPAPGETLFLRARAGVALNAARVHRPVCEQGFKP